jgi:hypothetical protein
MTEEGFQHKSMKTDNKHGVIFVFLSILELLKSEIQPSETSVPLCLNCVANSRGACVSGD